MDNSSDNPDLASLELLFETEEGLDVLIVVEEILLSFTNFQYLQIKSFEETVLYAWYFALALADLVGVDPFEMLQERKFWELLVESKLLGVEE